MYDRYEHRFTVSAIRTPAGVSWSLEEMDPELTVYDKVIEQWVDLPSEGMLADDDMKMTKDLARRLGIDLKLIRP